MTHPVPDWRDETKGLRPRDCGTKPGGSDQETGQTPRIPWSGNLVSFKPKVQGSNPCALTHQIGIPPRRRFREPPSQGTENPQATRSTFASRSKGFWTRKTKAFFPRNLVAKQRGTSPGNFTPYVFTGRCVADPPHLR